MLCSGRSLTLLENLSYDRDATRPNKPDELLLWLRGRYPNDTDEELTKRFRERATI